MSKRFEVRKAIIDLDFIFTFYFTI